MEQCKSPKMPDFRLTPLTLFIHSHHALLESSLPCGAPSRLAANGMESREIAERLRISEHSIRNYLCRIFDNLGVSSRVELILCAFNQRDQKN